MTDVVPFLAALRGDKAEVRDLATTLPVKRPVGEVVSLWSAKPAEAQVSAADITARAVADAQGAIAAARAAAVAQGREEGMAEIAAQRAELAKVIAALGAAREAKLDEVAETIAGIVGEVVTAWIGNEDRAALFAPVVRSWLAAGSAGTARVHPADVAAIAAAVGDSIAIVADAAIAPGDIAIASPERELVLTWKARIGELREAVAAAIVGGAA